MKYGIIQPLSVVWNRDRKRSESNRRRHTSSWANRQCDRNAHVTDADGAVAMVRFIAHELRLNSGIAVCHADLLWTLSAVDFDTDGKVDVVSTEFSTTTGEIVVYKNDGTGNFARTVLATGLPLISRSRVADLNGDARPDIVYFKNGTTLVLQMGNVSGGLRRTRICG